MRRFFRRPSPPPTADHAMPRLRLRTAAGRPRTTIRGGTLHRPQAPPAHHGYGNATHNRRTLPPRRRNPPPTPRPRRPKSSGTHTLSSSRARTHMGSLSVRAVAHSRSAANPGSPHRRVPRPTEKAFADLPEVFVRHSQRRRDVFTKPHRRLENTQEWQKDIAQETKQPSPRIQRNLWQRALASERRVARIVAHPCCDAHLQVRGWCSAHGW